MSIQLLAMVCGFVLGAAALRKVGIWLDQRQAVQLLREATIRRWDGQ